MATTDANQPRLPDPDGEASSTAWGEPLEVEIVRSPRRRKTVQAFLEAGRVRVLVPASMSPDEERRYVDELVERLSRRRRAEGIDLVARCRRLADRYSLPRPRSVRWSDNQRKRWGSCTMASGEIRVSTRLLGAPSWVLDYVLIHELAHLVVPDHSSDFHAIVDRYPRAERARGFLIARGLDEDDRWVDGADGTDA